MGRVLYNTAGATHDRTYFSVDLDDTFWDLMMNPLRHFLNEKHGRNLQLADITSFKTSEVYGITEEISAANYAEFYANHHHLVQPVEDAIAVMEKIKKRHRLISITARKISERDLTLQHIERVGAAHLFEAVHFTDEKSKAELCVAEEVDVKADDGHHNAVDISETGAFVLLMNRPWNLHLQTPANTARVNGWLDIKKYFDGL